VRALRLIGGALAAAALLSACGSGVGLIPSDSAATLHDDLANIQLAFSTPDCTLAAAYVAKANDDFDNLPQSISRKLLTQLQTAMNAVAADEQRQCHNATTGPTSGSSSPTGPTGSTGSSSTTSSTTTSTTTSSSTSSSSTSTSTSQTGTTGVTGSTCTTTTGVGGGTPACDGTTSSSGIGGGGTGTGGTGSDTGAASVGN
jgi:cobalamin biosynthesis Mg chelatase CobN